MDLHALGIVVGTLSTIYLLHGCYKLIDEAMAQAMREAEDGEY